MVKRTHYTSTYHTWHLCRVIWNTHKGFKIYRAATKYGHTMFNLEVWPRAVNFLRIRGFPRFWSARTNFAIDVNSRRIFYIFLLGEYTTFTGSMRFPISRVGIRLLFYWTRWILSLSSHECYEGCSINTETVLITCWFASNWHNIQYYCKIYNLFTTNCLNLMAYDKQNRNSIIFKYHSNALPPRSKLYANGIFWWQIKSHNYKIIQNKTYITFKGCVSDVYCKY